MAESSEMTRAEVVEALRAERERFARFGQVHVFRFVLPEAETELGTEVETETLRSFLTQAREIDLQQVQEIFQTVSGSGSAAGEEKKSEDATAADTLAPIRDFASPAGSSAEETARWTELGQRAICDGKVAAVVLSGGQGTRLGFDGPKGMFPVGLPSGHTLFQYHVERVRKAAMNAQAWRQSTAVDDASSTKPATIPLYVMTSQVNDRVIRDFFEENNFFGGMPEDIIFFEQNMLPCLDGAGKIILESAYQIAFAPNGNGGIYEAMSNTGVLADMQSRGVEHVHAYGIDNLLSRTCDPLFIGHCIDKAVDTGSKVVWKTRPDEKVGVLANRNGRCCVVEYSEMTQEDTELRDEATGKLAFGGGNICSHYFALSFIVDTVLPKLSNIYHCARKKIPYAGEDGTTIRPESPNGIKAELFIFDVFPLAENVCLLEVDRAEEFAPIKNAPGAASDSPDTTRAMYSAACVRWLQAAGATVVIPEVDGTAGEEQQIPAYVEISPLVSYAGEGLEACAGRTFTAPCFIGPGDL